MEIVSIEKGTFEEMMARFEGFVHRMEHLCEHHNERGMSGWLDNQDVC